MNTLDPIVIVVACDNHYMIMLAALLKSIEVNHKTAEEIIVYVVEDNVSTVSKKRLQESIDRNKIKLEWIKMNEAIPAGMKFPIVNNTYPLNTYIRLFIPYFIPAQYKKVLFLDVDMVVLEDISKLWHCDIKDHIIGAVNDSITRFIGNLEGGGISNYVELGLDPKAKYFNAGLQLINTTKWKEHNITEKVINSINDNAKYANMGDQYGLNVVLVNQWYELDPFWNYMANGKHPNPFLIHFIHRKPFYKSYSNNPHYQKIFYEYLKKTKWKGAKPIGESRRYLKKIGNLLEKVPLFFSGK